jgi:hypothetical protein
MRLECPICGKKYGYESKICKECEDYSIYSNLSPKYNTIEEKWNCAMFLEQSNCVFGRGSREETLHKAPVELFELKVGQVTYYSWNGGLKKKEENHTIQRPIDYQTVGASKRDKLLSFGKKLNLHLVYE